MTDHSASRTDAPHATPEDDGTETTDSGARPGGPTDGSARGVLSEVRRLRPSVADTLGQFRSSLAVSTTVFGLAALVGYAVVGPTVSTDLATEGSRRTALAYFLNNGLVAAGLVGGFAVVTLGILAYNGVTLGVAVRVGLDRGLAPETVVALIAPHGVVEIPALLLAAAVGLFLARRVVAYRRGRRPEIVSAAEERRFYAALVLVYAGITVAAVIEAHLTPRL